MKYYFRGNLILQYDPEYPREMKTTDDFNMCLFLPEDYANFREFFLLAEQHAQGKIKDNELKDFEVN